MTHFETTQWGVVLAAASERPSQAQPALAALCNTYWRPVYSYIRHRGSSVEDAKDLTQEFFAVLIERNSLKGVDPAKGRFRSFLLASVNHFLSNHYDVRNAKKRGGDVRFIRMDFTAMEERYLALACHEKSPEMLFDRGWALATIESALAQLRREYERHGNETLFNGLKGTLTGQDEQIPYRKLGDDLGLSEGAVKVAVHRMRRRYRDVLLEVIAQTMSQDESVEEELQLLFSALGS